MAHIDGFVIPVKLAEKERYIAMARQISEAYLARGATRCVESWAEGIDQGTRTSFPRAVEASNDEAVVFSWMEFPDKATSDAAHEAVWADPAIEAFVSEGLIDGQRMIIGGFDVIQDLP